MHGTIANNETGDGTLFVFHICFQ